ncbi:methionine--tRNA ligase [Candidatus Shapirobacteria bacterium CG03_land_8_20_14_0_80_40_19]|uniref:Methionine--tRNA ligase n=3 Tax=Candidatus Shapironibacteriota TaxID=1752721 RepID=A0A2M7BFA8_9BACT|nr:MAG: methionine--tRNA ligase [Candidatus Shapirobacteria bacterium CG11_big_fil_rev_8_21_14_0_20_40_12]PIV01822.1 MAG: methionine--tRNA ligase [Candidatus Shapirobacteria bacterium CG03_land_8_20_14_0_80_40_19]PJC76539.1 MAG: methionine--tRNA ligase [Candidatus Shapirobacteria bacterium CG_4_8_14_3_um_filter_39_11]
MIKPLITYSDFEKLDMRIGTIIQAEEVLGSQKLIKFTVDLGSEAGLRTILSGIKKDFDWQALIGTQALVLVNLEPKGMMGLESQGMILMAVERGEQAEKITLLVPQEKIPEGTGVE